MARRAIKTERAPASSTSTPRAKSIASADRALDRYAEASRSFDALCDEHGGLGRIDTRYAELAEAAEVLVRSMLLQPRASASGSLQDLLNGYALERRKPGEHPEADIRLAELALREANVRRAVS